MYEYIKTVILGIVQGLTEFIPVSSSGHLIIFQEVMAFSGSLAFDVALHFGTFIALLWYFRADIRNVLKDITQKGGHKGKKLVFNVVVATIPAIIAGLFLEDIIEQYLRSPVVVSITLLIGGILLILSDNFKSVSSIDDLNTTKSLYIGLLQSIALIPGVSRSGITIIAGRSLRMTNEQATRFSFLLAIPVLFGATVRVFIDSTNISLLVSQTGVFVVGFFTALVSGYLAIQFMMHVVERYGLSKFGWYRIVLGVTILAVITLF